MASLYQAHHRWQTSVLVDLEVSPTCTASAAAHGQGGWLAWADAVVLELMSIASGLEMRRRKRQHKPVLLPAAVLVCAVALSISAQVVEAERSVIGWIAAALPALGSAAA